MVQNGFPNGFSRNMSTDSAFGEMNAHIGNMKVRHTDSPQLSSSGRGSTRTTDTRPITPPLKTSRPVTPVQQQPLGLPAANRAKLVPGRMSNTKLDKRREVPSTAV